MGEMKKNRVLLNEANSLVALLEQNAALFPDNIAVQDSREKLSYRELYRESSRFAARLLAIDPAVGQKAVPLFTTKSVAAMVGIYGIMMAGACYVPLDPAQPQARLLKILASLKAPFIVTDRSTSAARDWMLGQRLLLLDDPSTPADFSPARTSAIPPCQLAYVIFTSGTTGVPKGVSVEHQAVLNFLKATWTVFNDDFSQHDRLLSLVNMSFDVSIFEFFVPLSCAGTLVIPHEQAVNSMRTTLQLLETHSITTVYLPPAHLHGLAREQKKDPKSLMLQRMLVGVEPIKHEILDQYLNAMPELTVVNGYGPTEATVCATFYRYERDHHRNEPYIPIGKALSGNRIHLLKEDLTPVAEGEVGEIFITGHNLARGYLNDGELTAQKFVFLTVTGIKERFYRTGDLARRLPDGNLLFMGRSGGYVKIDGYRIDPSEVEVALLKVDGIAKVKVVAREIAGFGKVLLAYFVSTPGFDKTTREMRGLLMQELPVYMLPRFFVPLQEFPVNGSGKIDIDRLPLPEVAVASA
jgi:amino acid adenylation domain-containing protein